MLAQEEMIARVRDLCQQDERIVAALMYGSFTKGEGDAYSDIEFYIFLGERAYESLDPRTWVAQLAPVLLYFVNEFGTGTAIFDNLVRGEFHFQRASEMSSIRSWKHNGPFPSADAMLVVDRTGELREHLHYLSAHAPDRATPEAIAQLWRSFLNWMLFGSNVLMRGERARSLEILGFVHRHLLWLSRIQEGTTTHWPTPSKNVERDLSLAAYQRFVTCTADLHKDNLERAYLAAWRWGNELAQELSIQYVFDFQMPVVQALDTHLQGVALREGGVQDE